MFPSFGRGTTSVVDPRATRMKKTAAASATSHATNMQMKNNRSSSSISVGVFKKLLWILLVGLVAWSYQAIQPPPPRICGSPNGPSVTSSRVKLKDGRHLAYLESGVPKEKASYKIVFVHGFYSSRYDVLPISQELLEQLGVYLLSFDRAGYGESDPDAKKTERSTALDIEELADQLGLGSKFYVIGYSMGGNAVWGCLKYIPHRLSGAALVAPVANYWWRFPAEVFIEGYKKQLTSDQWAVWVAHYTPWLTYWWNTQKWFPTSSVIARRPELFSPEDIKLLPKLAAKRQYMAQPTQQGEFETLHRDMMVGFGSWKFDPLLLDKPSEMEEGSIHLWHGNDDRIVPVVLSQYISKKLPWIRYHEVPNAGHMFPLDSDASDRIVKALLLGEEK